jgi:hypothetical protein
MKKLLFFASVLLVSTFFIISCSEDEPITESNLKIEPNVNLNDYSIWGEVISTIFKKQEAQTYYLNTLKNGWEDELSIPLAVLLTNEDAVFVTYFKQAVAELNLDISVEDFISFLRQNPDLALSFYYPDVRTLEEIEIFDASFKVAVIPNHDAEVYNFYKNGLLSITQNSNIDPDFMVLVLQKREGFIALSKNGTEADFEATSVTPYCVDLATQFATLNQNSKVNNTEILLQGVTYPNPLYDIYILKDKDIINGYNDKCGIQNPTANDRVSNSGSRMTCERDGLDDEENVERIKTPYGTSTLDLFGCKWTNKHCTFQINIFVPTAQTSSQSYFVTNNFKVIHAERKYLKNKGWVWTNLNIFKWKYLEGIDGDYWQYNWIGKHPKGTGTTITNSIGFSFSPTITFKEPISGGELTFNLGQGLTAMHSVQRKTTDFDFGNDVIEYCDLCSANGWQGTTYSTGTIEFSVREGGN